MSVTIETIWRSRLSEQFSLGIEKNRRLLIRHIPPSKWPRILSWAEPYSIRSFLSQASEQLGGCHYWCENQGTVMGKPSFADRCCDPNDEYEQWRDDWECHVVAGWTKGEISCSLYEKIASLCHTESEKRFLYQYLGYAKHRQFPMLLPQARIGIAEKRRPDFVAFVPLQLWNYKWLAVELDAAHSESQREEDARRDADLEEQNYTVISLRPKNKGYFEEVQHLVERIEAFMNVAEEDPRSVAIDVEVIRSVDVNPPF